MALLDMRGRVLREIGLNGDQVQDLSLQGIASSIYMVQWSNLDGRKAIARLVVQ